MKIPPILLEGDAPAAPAPSGPGQRYALGPIRPPTPAADASRRIAGSLRHATTILDGARSALALRPLGPDPATNSRNTTPCPSTGIWSCAFIATRSTASRWPQIHVHPESRNWFVPVPAAGAKYLADLGYYDADRQLGQRWPVPAATLTPPDNLSDETVSALRHHSAGSAVCRNCSRWSKRALRQHVPLVEAMQQMRAQGFKDLPAPEAGQVRMDARPGKGAGGSRFDGPGAAHLDRFAGNHRIDPPPASTAGFLDRRGAIQPAFLDGARCPVFPARSAGAERRRGFWFNVNAELIIYGATEPDAKVTIGDRQIKLRPDGTFSFRFALPDGEYPLPAAAHSADGEETREAQLEFSREHALPGRRWRASAGQEAEAAAGQRGGIEPGEPGRPDLSFALDESLRQSRALGHCA